MASTRPMMVIPIAMSLLMTGSVDERGGSFMISLSPCSRPRANAGAPSLTRFSHNSWTGRSGIGMPSNMALKMIRISPTLQASRK